MSCRVVGRCRTLSEHMQISSRQSSARLCSSASTQGILTRPSAGPIARSNDSLRREYSTFRADFDQRHSRADDHPQADLDQRYSRADEQHLQSRLRSTSLSRSQGADSPRLRCAAVRARAEVLVGEQALCFREALSPVTTGSHSRVTSGMRLLSGHRRGILSLQTVALASQWCPPTTWPSDRLPENRLGCSFRRGGDRGLDRRSRGAKR